MSIYNINPQKRNFLTRGFVTTAADLDAFAVVQDPTFLSFKVEFFFPGTITNPTNGVVSPKITDPFLINTFSSEGLLLPPRYSIDNSTGVNTTTPNSPTFSKAANLGEYDFVDSAEDYLYAIGSANRIGYLRSFKQFLYKLQTEAPWYFQKISGADGLYKLEPEVNTKKDAALTFECLETVDMRMSMLADFYRLAAFDFERHREVLPMNLRTFKMRIHVIEMRNFNTTFGTLASLIRSPQENKTKESLQQEVVSNRQNRFFEGLVDRFAGSSNAFARGNTPVTQKALDSAFDAVSIQTYELGKCEFDFYSEAPGYLDDLNVTDSPQASYKFKIKYHTVRKIAKYSFYDYLTDYVVTNSLFPKTGTQKFNVNSVDVGNPSVVPFYDANSANANMLKNYNPIDAASKTDIGSAIYSQSSAADNPVTSQEKRKISDSEDLKAIPPNPRPSVGGILGKALGAAESAVATAVNRVQSRVNSALLGNIYDKIPSPAEIGSAISGFFNPDLKLPGRGEISQPIYDPGSVQFQPTPVDNSISTEPMQTLPVDTTLTRDKFDPLPVDTTLTKEGLDPLPVDRSLDPFSLESLPVDNSLTKDSIQPLPVDNTISGNGYDSLPIDNSIQKTALESLEKDPNIFGGGYDSLEKNSQIVKNPIESLPLLNQEIESSRRESLQALSSEISQLPQEISPVKTGDFSSFTTYLDVDVETPSPSPLETFASQNSISELSSGNLQNLAQTITKDPLRPLETNKSIENKDSGFDPLQISKSLINPNVNFEGVNPLNSISQDPIDSFSSEKKIVGGGMESIATNQDLITNPLNPLASNRAIEKSSLEGVEIPKELIEKNVNFTGVRPVNEVSQDPLNPYNVDSQISRDGLNNLEVKKTIFKDPLQPLPTERFLSEDSVNFEATKLDNKISKEETIETPPPSPKISPKNIYKRY